MPVVESVYPQGDISVMSSALSRSGRTLDRSHHKEVNASDKENSKGNVETTKSKLKAPQPAANILESKRTSGEMKLDDLKEEPIPGDPELVRELRASEINYEEILKTKISAAGKTLNDQKQRMAEQKSLILKLREALQDLLDKRETLIRRYAGEKLEMSTKMEELEKRIGDMDAQINALNAKLKEQEEAYGRLQEEVKEKEEKIVSMEKDRASEMLEKRRVMDERDIAKAEAAVLKGELESSRKEAEGAKKEVNELSEAVEKKQVAHDKELNELREKLGQEMVAAHEARSKHTATQEQLTELKTKFAVLEENHKTSKSELERLEGEKKERQEKIDKLEQEKTTSATKLEDMQARMDAREQQHNDAIKSLAMGQELQNTRIKELTEVRGRRGKGREGTERGEERRGKERRGEVRGGRSNNFCSLILDVQERDSAQDELAKLKLDMEHLQAELNRSREESSQSLLDLRLKEARVRALPPT
eukprot:768653-Hanusia_phi.AAC.2